MGFFNTLGKIAYGTIDFMVEAVEKSAKRINRMSDDEIKKMYSEPVDDVRHKAEMAQMKAEMWKMNEERRKMCKEAERKMREEAERLGEKFEKG